MDHPIYIVIRRGLVSVYSDGDPYILLIDHDTGDDENAAKSAQNRQKSLDKKISDGSVREIYC